MRRSAGSPGSVSSGSASRRSASRGASRWCAAHVTRLVQLLAPLGVDIAMTTNGVRLPELAHDLAAAGLKRINVSLDSLQRERFFALTKRDELDRVVAGIDAALLAGLAPVKVNAVIMRGINDDEVVDLARFGRERGVGVRFIEFMPLDAQGEWSHDKVVPADEILERINAVFPLDAGDPDHVEPAARYVFRDGIGDVGVISSVSEPFCESCDRVPRHGRGSVPDVPVRARRDRPACRAAGRQWSRRARPRRPACERDRGCRCDQVGRAPHRPGRLRPTRSVDESDRRLIAARRVRALVGSEQSCCSPPAPTLGPHASRVHAP